MAAQFATPAISALNAKIADLENQRREAVIVDMIAHDLPENPTAEDIAECKAMELINAKIIADISQQINEACCELIELIDPEIRENSETLDYDTDDTDDEAETTGLHPDTDTEDEADDIEESDDDTDDTEESDDDTEDFTESEDDEADGYETDSSEFDAPDGVDGVDDETPVEQFQRHNADLSRLEQLYEHNAMNIGIYTRMITVNTDLTNYEIFQYQSAINTMRVNNIQLNEHIHGTRDLIAAVGARIDAERHQFQLQTQGQNAPPLMEIITTHTQHQYSQTLSNAIAPAA